MKQNFGYSILLDLSKTRTNWINSARNYLSNEPTSELARRGIAKQRPGPTHGLQGLFLDPSEQSIASRDVVNETNDLASSPDLCTKLEKTPSTEYRVGSTYTIIRVTVQEDLTTTLAANIGSNLAKVTGLALLLNLQCILSHLVGEQT